MTRNYVIAFSAAAALLWSCASTRSKDTEAQVRVFNVYRTGVEALPRELDGCDFLGSVSATVPEIEGGVGFFDPKGVLPTIRARAARKSADTVLVSIAPEELEHERRTLRGTIFRCGGHPLPLELGEPLR